MRKIFLAARLAIACEKVIPKRLFLLAVDRPSFLNEATTFFLILSSVGSLLLLIAASLSPCTVLYFLSQLISIIYQEYVSQLVHKSRLH